MGTVARDAHQSLVVARHRTLKILDGSTSNGVVVAAGAVSAVCRRRVVVTEHGETESLHSRRRTRTRYYKITIVLKPYVHYIYIYIYRMYNYYYRLCVRRVYNSIITTRRAAAAVYRGNMTVAHVVYAGIDRCW